MSYPHHRSMTMDPSIPPFQPSGGEMTLHHNQMHSDPRGFTALSDMRQLILQSNSNLTREIHSLERQTNHMAEDIQSVTEAFRNDMQYFQRTIHDLRTQINEMGTPKASSPETIKSNEQDEGIVTLVKAFKANNNLSPSHTLRMLAGNEEKLAEAYLDQAEDAEKFAAKVRERAHIILGDVIHSPATIPMKYAGSSNASVPASARVRAVTEDERIKMVKTEANGVKHPDSRSQDENMTWAPRAVREMPQYSSKIPTSTETFTWEFLTSQLGGEKWSPGFYFISKDSVIKSKSYWILEADWEPFLPDVPGGNGAKLTVFFNDTLNDSGKAPTEKNYLNSPVFIRAKGETTYQYFGQYSQKRFSDKLDYDRVTVTVPKHVRHVQAEQLADPRRPEWVTRALMQNFWPKPEYEGPLPRDSDDGDGETTKSRVSEALWEYAESLTEWEREARMKAKLLTTPALMKAFENADADAEPGLRMHWEYMQCVAYDRDFYAWLVQRKRDLASAPSPHHHQKTPDEGAGAAQEGGGEDGSNPKVKVGKVSPTAQDSAPRENLRDGGKAAAFDPARRFQEFAAVGRPKGNQKTLRH